MLRPACRCAARPAIPLLRNAHEFWHAPRTRTRPRAICVIGLRTLSKIPTLAATATASRSERRPQRDAGFAPAGVPAWNLSCYADLLYSCGKIDTAAPRKGYLLRRNVYQQDELSPRNGVALSAGN